MVVEEVVAAVAEVGVVDAAAAETTVEVGVVDWDWDCTAGSSAPDPPIPVAVGEDTLVAAGGKGVAELVDAAPVAKPSARPQPWNPS